jgi:anti-sigma regulatory factor (Ser/Thr protein kinase)
VRRELGDGLPAPVLYDLLTVVSELVNNAVVHGDAAPVRMIIDVSAGGVVFGEVVNAGEGRPELGEIVEDTGLGLHIVDAIAEFWTASAQEGRTQVRFVLRPS